jgi:hypothetical protein
MVKEVNDSGRKQKQYHSNSAMPCWVRKIVVRVCVGIIIGLVSPHSTEMEPRTAAHGEVCIVDIHAAHNSEVCIVDIRT